MAKRIGAIISGLAKQFFRSPGSVFWTIAFPVMLILIFGAIFSGGGTSTYNLYVQDLDDSQISNNYIEGLNDTGVLHIIEVPADADPAAYIESHSVTSMLIIPKGFENDFNQQTPTTIELRQDSTSGSAMAVMTAVNAVTQQMNLQRSGGINVIEVQTANIVSEHFSYIDFFLPGTIGLMIMMVSVQSIVGYQTRFRNNGIFRKLATTPMNNAEWLIGMMIWMLVMVAISVVATMATGILLYDVSVSIDAVSIAIIILSTMLFTAIGMIIAQFVKDEEVAGTAAGAVTFPMMFLAGSFFPLESMPAYLQSFAQVLPLTYVNNGLRDAMIYGNASGALDNLLIIAAMTIALALITVMISGWKRE
ncbi:MAG: ABC transporter permease [Euryarchaeota archaeon]|nr:ABC transporter permease [Euryarchaeota archaeon]